MASNPYNTRQWQRMRKRQLEKEPLCRMCKDMGRTTVATVADHKIPWRTGKSEEERYELFHAEDNLQSLCATCHSGFKRMQDNIDDEQMIDIDGTMVSGGVAWGVDKEEVKVMEKVTVVYGPPGSGKSTYVRKNMNRGDVVVDYDSLYAALSGMELHDKPANLQVLIYKVRQAIYKEIEWNKDKLLHVWIITGGAKKRDREKLVKRFDAGSVLVMATLNECFTRLKKDKTRIGGWKASKEMVEKWFQLYEK